MESGGRRVRIEIRGIVQGVGFRPFVYRLANRHHLTGWVKNVSGAVVLEAQGADGEVARFLAALTVEHPPLATLRDLSVTEIALLRDEADFAILESSAGEAEINVSPDCDVCPDCLEELFDPANRRYRYPFITCTNCGPRYSIITGTPYDRPLTTMVAFSLCPECLTEYHDPLNRRFHAQPVACAACGPKVRLLRGDGSEVAGDPLAEAGRLLRGGAIVAVKGIGGYHLSVDALDPTAVERLRERKHRDEKPFAVMAENVGVVHRHAFVSSTEERLLTGPERPIVLLRKTSGCGIADSVAPNNGYLGFMLPSSPLHYLLLREVGRPLVMTSGNRSDEPMAYRDDEALARLSGIADYFLVHDRPIQVRVDDSVLRVFEGNPLFLRRSRGFVPRPIRLPLEVPPVLALGADLKSCPSLAAGDRALMGHHVGDLQNPETLAALRAAVTHLQELFRFTPQVVAHDLHPDYHSTRLAEEYPALPAVAVQHHHAHMASCMAENGLDGEVIGIVFDGTGYGTDGTVWGGEFLTGGYAGFQRRGHLATVRLPGGDAATREPARMALSWLYRFHGERVWELPLSCFADISATERRLYLAMLAKGLNSPLTSSCGRLFDAVAAILDLRRRVTYEGQGAMELEGLAEKGAPAELFPYELVEERERVVLDFAPAVATLAERYLAGEPREDLARAIHATLAEAAAEVAAGIGQRTGLERVVLSGGVFQNRLMYADLTKALRKRGLTVYVHRLVSPGDGGLALGQALVGGASYLRHLTAVLENHPCAT